MRRALALLLLLGTAAIVTRYSGDDPRSVGLAFGFALIAAALSGDVFERFRLPRITGYLAFGMLCGPYLANILSAAMARELQIVNGLAIALIAFIAGLELNLQRLRPRLAGIARYSITLLSGMYAGLFAGIWLAWPWLPILPEASGLARLALASLTTTIIVSFSPTVTIAVITDSRARGPLSELVLAIVVVADLVLIVFFTLSMQLVRWALGESVPGDVSLFVQLTWEIAGSFAFGALLGSLFALYLRYVGREITLMLLVLCAIASQLGAAFQFEPLLIALAAGLVVENIAQPSGEALKAAVERGAFPVLVVFFAAAGASLQLDALATVGLIAVAVSLARIAFIRLGAGAAVRFSGLNATAGLAWMGLVSQAGVTLGLTVLVASQFPDWGLRLQTLMVALIAMHEVIGPILFRAALTRAGEVGMMDAEDATAQSGLPRESPVEG